MEGDVSLSQVYIPIEFKLKVLGSDSRSVEVLCTHSVTLTNRNQ